MVTSSQRCGLYPRVLPREKSPSRLRQALKTRQPPRKERFRFLACLAYISINRHRFTRSRLRAEDIRLFRCIRLMTSASRHPFSSGVKFANQRFTSPTLSNEINTVGHERPKSRSSVPSLSPPPGTVRGTRECDPSLLRLDSPRRCSVNLPRVHRN